MKNDPAESHETEIADESVAAANLHAEIDELRQRLAAIEAGARKQRRRPTPKMLALLIAGVMLVGATIVFGEDVANALFISAGGNVGIGTTSPSATLDVNGEIRARTATINGELKPASLRFPDGTTQATAAPPAGAVIAFNLSACPAGWSEYTPARGRFIRGIDKSGGNIDPDGQRSLGSTQDDAIRNITGSVSGPMGAGNRAWDWGFRPGTSGAFTVPNNLGTYNRYAGDYTPPGGVGTTANFDASKVVPTAAENRPKNVALLYCQKN